jgi:hypothetical protein
MQCSRAAPSVSAGSATGALADFSPRSRQGDGRRDPFGRISRPEKSLQRLEKAQNGLGNGKPQAADAFLPHGAKAQWGRVVEGARRATPG